MSSLRSLILCVGFLVCAAVPAMAQDPAPAPERPERPYFVTYDHSLEKRGDVDIGVANTTGLPKDDRPAYNAPWIELEYGVTNWWTTELYLEGVITARDGSGFTGWRWEQRVRPLRSPHRVNPVLYVEYERLNEATRIQTEIVGSGPLPVEPIHDLRQIAAHELEGKLILSSDVRGWNVSENAIFEKNLSANEGVEFGYSVGVSRSLGGRTSGTTCHVCRERFVAGIEAYGGLGSTHVRGLNNTRHFLAPVLAWHLSERATLKASTGFGLTNASDRYLVRIALTYER
jgi:hypothetical protein